MKFTFPCTRGHTLALYIHTSMHASWYSIEMFKITRTIAHETSVVLNNHNIRIVKIILFLYNIAVVYSPCRVLSIVDQERERLSSC